MQRSHLPKLLPFVVIALLPSELQRKLKLSPGRKRGGLIFKGAP